MMASAVVVTTKMEPKLAFVNEFVIPEYQHEGKKRLRTRVVGDVGSASFDAQSLMVGLDRGVVFLPS